MPLQLEFTLDVLVCVHKFLKSTLFFWYAFALGGVPRIVHAVYHI